MGKVLVTIKQHLELKRGKFQILVGLLILLLLPLGCTPASLVKNQLVGMEEHEYYSDDPATITVLSGGGCIDFETYTIPGWHLFGRTIIGECKLK